MWKAGLALGIVAAAIFVPALIWNNNNNVDDDNNNSNSHGPQQAVSGGSSSSPPQPPPSSSTSGGGKPQEQQPAAGPSKVDHDKMGIFFPLFMPPGKIWDEMLQYRNEHPTVPWMVAINPDNGPGRAPQKIYSENIEYMKQHDIRVLGYVSTFWAGQPIEQAKHDIKAYRNFYDLDGIFLDEMSNDANYVNYYRQLAAYAKSLGLNYVVGNTGTDAAPAYVGVVDNIVISEGYGVPDLSRLAGWHVEHDKSNFSYIAHTQTTIDRSYVATSKDFVSYIFITDDYMPNPYDEFPSHFDELLQLLDPGSNGRLHNVVVKSVNLSNSQPVNGTLKISQGSSVEASGLGWITHVGKEGDTYTVTAHDNRNYVFYHWEDGSRSKQRTVKLGDNSAILTAYYAERSGPPEPALLISAMTTDGSQLSMWAVVTGPDGKEAASGYTPLRFEGEPGRQYTIHVSEWSNYKFARWSDDDNDNKASGAKTITYSGGEQFVNALFEFETEATPQNTLTVNAYNQNSQIVTMWTVISVNGTTAFTGYTPLTVPVKEGQTYTVSVADYGDTVFDRWADGGRSNTTSLAVHELHEQVTAYFKSGNVATVSSNNNDNGNDDNGSTGSNNRK